MRLDCLLKNFLFEGLKLVDFDIDGLNIVLCELSDGIGVWWWVLQETWHLTDVFLSDFLLTSLSLNR